MQRARGGRWCDGWAGGNGMSGLTAHGAGGECESWQGWSWRGLRVSCVCLSHHFCVSSVGVQCFS